MNERERAEAARDEIQETLRAALSRLVLARATMRAYLKDGDTDTLEAWLLAAQEQGWLDEIKAALGKNEEADAITEQGGSA